MSCMFKYRLIFKNKNSLGPEKYILSMEFSDLHENGAVDKILSELKI